MAMVTDPEQGSAVRAAPGSLSREDFVSPEAPRWCAGCGDFSVLAQLQRVLAEAGEPPEMYAMVSGIGCSGRLPYYLNTNGFHSIHGRAPAIATGVKAVRPDLTVWVFTGDGDALSIGGNHLLHAMRRNVDIKVLLMNNRIYGLTKGQASPTSEMGKITKSTPRGSVDEPINPVSIALAAGATFVARSVGADGEHLREVLRRAALHRGSAFVEVLQNCAIFNDGAWDEITAPAVRDERLLRVGQGQPMVFGKERDRGIRLRGLTPEVVSLNGSSAMEDLLVHDERLSATANAYLLAAMSFPDFPIPIGVFRDLQRPSHHELLRSGSASRDNCQDDLSHMHDLLEGSDVWRVARE
jgi:2-oxoglutarate ferredoxin oxidoreductase subunit beta